MRINKLFIAVFCIVISLSTCQSRLKVIKSMPPIMDDVFFYNYTYSYIDFPNEDTIFFESSMYVEETFEDVEDRRIGRIIDGFKEGVWYYGDVRIDSLNEFQIDLLKREEYFKHGLRDSIFRIYAYDSEIIYETAFNKGTGVLKDYHSNGQLYYSVEIKDGYFTDTLTLFDKGGKLKEKILYDKDTITYHLVIEKSGYESISTKRISQRDYESMSL